MQLPPAPVKNQLHVNLLLQELGEVWALHHGRAAGISFSACVRPPFQRQLGITPASIFLSLNLRLQAIFCTFLDFPCGSWPVQWWSDCEHSSRGLTPFLLLHVLSKWICHTYMSISDHDTFGWFMIYLQLIMLSRTPVSKVLLQTHSRHQL